MPIFLPRIPVTAIVPSPHHAPLDTGTVGAALASVALAFAFLVVIP
jgi:hypothetical protein